MCIRISSGQSSLECAKGYDCTHQRGESGEKARERERERERERARKKRNFLLFAAFLIAITDSKEVKVQKPVSETKNQERREKKRRTIFFGSLSALLLLLPSQLHLSLSILKLQLKMHCNQE